MKRIVGLALVLVLLCSAFAASAEILKQGSQGASVRALQEKMKELKYYQGAIDGVYGKALYEAVWRLQKDIGLKADGIAGPKTLGRLGLASSSAGTSNVAVPAKGLTVGAKGNTVAALQTALRDLGYYGGSSTGTYDDALWKAVWQYQRDKGFSATGVADAQLVAALGLNAGASAVAQQGLTVGAKGNTVAALQTALRNLGYYGGTSTGTYDDALWKAVWQYQRDKGFSRTGMADARVLSALGVTGSGSAVTPGLGLSYGAKGAAVRSLQIALQKAGYYVGAVDGVYGDGTYTAVWRYQRDKGLSTDGVANAQVLSLLGLSGVGPVPSGTSLSMGSKGDAVRVLQAALKNLGYYTIAVDGDYGYQTYLAVYNYQRAAGLTPDGVAGPQTLTMLGLGALPPSSGAVPAAKALKHGDKGAAVQALQTSLRNLKYYTGTVDGTYGDSTYTAVWWFQKNNKLSVTGQADTNTIAVLNSGYAVGK